MKTGWLVGIAGSFYLFVVVLFWPIEKQVLPAATTRISTTGYAHGEVIFSDEHISVRIPKTNKLQQKGLAGVEHLPDSDGMLWTYQVPQRVAFWMKGMLIPLDFVWIRGGYIVSLTEQVPFPVTSYSTDLPIIDPGIPVDGVLEVAAGYVQRHQLKIGDVAEIK